MKLQGLLSEEDRASTVVLAITPEPKADLEKMAQKVLAKAPGELKVTLLADPDHAVIKRYGLLNESATARGLPHPTTYVIDRRGVVRWKFTEVNYRVRPTNEMILEALRQVE